MKDWKKELSETCDEIKKIRKKYGNKRDSAPTTIQKILRTKYKLYIPRKYYKNKRHVLFEFIGFLQRRSYLLGYRQALEDTE